MSLTVGSQAPTWSGKDQHGTQRSSADYAGKWVLVYFYPKDDTPGCTIEACGFRDAFSGLKTQVEIIGVSADGVDSHKSFADKYDLPFTLIADPDKQIIAAFGTDNSVFKKRTSFLVSSDNTIAKIYEDIDCAAHASEIAADVISLKKSS